MSGLRILHCPTMIGGNPQGLARAERAVGLKSWAVVFEPTLFNYQTDETLFKPYDNLLSRGLKRWLFLARALREFDIIHFNFGQSILPEWFPDSMPKPPDFSTPLWRMYRWYTRLVEMRDLPILKKAGKGIVVTYQGSDARQGDFCRANFEISTVNEVGPEYFTPEMDSHKRQKIARFAAYADRIYSLNPDLLHMLPPQAQFIPYAHLNLKEWRAIPPENSHLDAPVVIHAPTNRAAKGTRFVLDAVTRLQAEGISFEFSLVEGLPHTEAVQLYQKADLLIDQLLYGWYGGLAVELMALGKPVICYIREQDLKFIPPQMRQDLPLIQATPATLYEILKEWLTVRKSELPERGRRSRAYVDKWHDSFQIAAKLKREYECIAMTKRSR